MSSVRRGTTPGDGFEARRQRPPALEGDALAARWPEGMSIEEHLQALADAGEIELVDESDIIWCERCGAATDRGACGCMRSVKRVG